MTIRFTQKANHRSSLGFIMRFVDHGQPDQNQVAEGNQIAQAHVNRLITFWLRITLRQRIDADVFSKRRRANTIDGSKPVAVGPTFFQIVICKSCLIRW